MLRLEVPVQLGIRIKLFVRETLDRSGRNKEELARFVYQKLLAVQTSESEWEQVKRWRYGSEPFNRIENAGHSSSSVNV
jgi:predicted NAD/FAD-dependent oxidoreductase